MPADDRSRLRQDVERALSDVMDPEMGQSVVDMGLIYDAYEKSGIVHVVMTTTTRGCPAAGFIVDAVRTRIFLAGVADRVEVELTYDPPWSPEMMRV